MEAIWRQCLKDAKSGQEAYENLKREFSSNVYQKRKIEFELSRLNMDILMKQAEQENLQKKLKELKISPEYAARDLLCVIFNEIEKKTGLKADVGVASGLRNAIWCKLSEDDMPKFVLCVTYEADIQNDELLDIHLFYDTGEKSKEAQAGTVAEDNGMYNEVAELPIDADKILEVMKQVGVVGGTTELEKLADKIVEDLDGSYSIGIQDGVVNCEFCLYTGRGVNEILYISPFTKEEFVRYVESFDPTEEVEVMRQDKTYRSAFTLRDALDDMEDFKNDLLKVCDKL